MVVLLGRIGKEQTKDLVRKHFGKRDLSDFRDDGDRLVNSSNTEGYVFIRKSDSRDDLVPRIIISLAMLGNSRRIISLVVDYSKGIGRYHWRQK